MTATADAPTTAVRSFGSLDAERLDRLDAQVARAKQAAEAFRALDQQQVDRIVAAMVRAGLRSAGALALLAVEETGFGVFEDKVIKNFVATEFLYDYLRDKKTVGVIDTDEELAIDYVAEPMGVILAIVPITNPTSTVLFKAICAAKTRNAMIFRPHPLAPRCALESVRVLAEAGEAAGLPPGALSVIPDVEHEATHYLFTQPDIDFLWTTGGQKIVELTNKAGKPALSVGPGNAPCYIHRTADLKGVVVDVLISKTFDASVICPAEQTLIIDAPVYDEVVEEFVRMGAHVLTPDEQQALTDFAFGQGPDGPVNLMALGQQAGELARRAGLDQVPADAKVLLATLPTDLDELAAHPLRREKLMPVLGVVRSPDVDHAVRAAVLVTEHGGLGHTSSVYAHDEDVIRTYAKEVRTGRILVNAPTAVGALGGVYNSLPPTFSLGCGTWGGSFTTENVNYKQLLNIKTVSRRKTPPQWFRVPATTFFNPGALENLRALPAQRVVIVSDAVLEHNGVLDQVKANLTAPFVKTFASVSPEPDESVVMAGVEMLRDVDPDLMIAVGGGSVLDAAKAMRLFHEHPELTLDELSLPFLDPRKRVADFPVDDHKVRLVAVPTTSGTGSEVSPATVLTVEGRKVTVVDYCLVPDMAVVDPLLTLSLPPTATAETGMDALTHALESAVSIFSSPYTDAFCMQSIRLILEWLPRAVAHPDDLEARTQMSNASTLAGLAFSNAFLGVNHALAHAVGAKFHLAHGRVNAIFLPHVLRYNASVPSKFMPAPGYTSYVAPEKYSTIGYILFGGRTDEERRQRLFDAVDQAVAEVGLPTTLREAGVDEAEFEAAIPELVAAAFGDVCMRTNPRMPMLSELEQLLRAAYG